MLDAGRAALDQAAGLRRLFRPSGIRVLPIVAGESSARLVAMLALACAAQGEQVLVLDQAEASVAMQFGVERVGALQTLLAGEGEYESVATELHERVHTLALGDEIARLTERGYPVRRFFRAFAEIDEPRDLILLHAQDTKGVAHFLGGQGKQTESEFLIVSGADEPALAAAYRRLKHIASSHRRFQLVVTGVTEPARALRAYRRIAQTAERFLGLVPAFGGFVPAQSIAQIDAQSNSAALVTPAMKRIAARAALWQLAEYSPATETEMSLVRAVH